MTAEQTNSPVLADLPTGRDALDFQPYVEALADILLDPHTGTPLTLGVFGSWGAGKTSLMEMLRARVAGSARGDGHAAPPHGLVQRLEVQPGGRPVARPAAGPAG